MAGFLSLEHNSSHNVLILAINYFSITCKSSTSPISQSQALPTSSTPNPHQLPRKPGAYLVQKGRFDSKHQVEETLVLVDAVGPTQANGHCLLVN